MKILVTGAGGMLGSDLAAKLRTDHQVTGVGLTKPSFPINGSYHDLDLSRKAQVRELVLSEKPDVIFHTAAMTDVDACETKPAEALRNNFEITKIVADAAAAAKAFLVHFSTDYVFDGTKQGEYTENDPPHPLNIYGETKLLAEKYIRAQNTKGAIFRITWLFGQNGRSFPRTLLEKSKSQKMFEVVSDQIGRPTYTKDVASTFVQLLAQKPDFFSQNGVETFHLTNSGEPVSWYDLSRFIFAEAGLDGISVKPIPTALGLRPALRPKNSCLSGVHAQAALGVQLRPWKAAVSEFVQAFLNQQGTR